MTNRVTEGFDWLKGVPSGSVSACMSADLFYEAPIGGGGPPAWTTGSGRFGGLCLVANWAAGYSNPTNPWVLLTGVVVAEGYVGAAIYRQGQNTGRNPVLGVFDAVNAGYQLCVELTDYGVVNLWRGVPGSGALLAQSAAGSFADNTWIFVELGFLLDPSVGWATVKINAGVPAHDTGIVIALTNVNTQATARALTDSICLTDHRANLNGTVAWDDLYFNDADGSTNNSFIGNVRVQQLQAAAPGAVTDLTIAGSSPAATNWQSVSDFKLDEAQFVETPTAGDYDLYGMAPMVNTGPVFALQARSAMRQDDATEIEGGNVLKSGATTVYGTPQLMSEGYVYVKDIFETDPNTGLGWLAAAVNAVQVGPQKVT
jgi:hypothetical protein